jgi:hypothetical protein
MNAQANQAAAAAPVFALAAVKYAAFASEETACFQATLIVDGQKLCRVSNAGHGGPDEFEPVGKLTRSQFEEVLHGIALSVNAEAYTRYAGPAPKVETFTDEEWEKAYEGEWWKRGPHSDETILSAIVGRLLDRHLTEKAVTRMLKTQLLALHADGKVYGWRLKDKRPGAWAQHEPAIRAHAAKNGNAITAVLNALPFAEAVAMYERATQ